MNLEIKLGNLKLKNPVILASGTFNRAITNHIDINKLGAVVTKTITLKPREGNPLPHIVKTKYGWLNSVGLKNPGINKYLKEDLLFWHKFKTNIICSIGGESIDEYVSLAQILNDNDIAAIEINVSCPNVENGLIFGSDPKLIAELIKNVRKVFKKTIIVKLSPNVTDITLIAKAALDIGADVLSLTNTVLGLEIDNIKKKPKLSKITSGYSGPAIKPISLRMVWQVYNKFKCPIIGGGGISNIDDVIDFIMCGATAVSIGSANLQNPKISIDIIKELEKYILKNNIFNLNEIRGVI